MKMLFEGLGLTLLIKVNVNIHSLFLFNFFSFFYDLILAPICILWYIIDEEKEMNIKLRMVIKK